MRGKFFWGAVLGAILGAILGPAGCAWEKNYQVSADYPGPGYYLNDARLGLQPGPAPG